MLQNLQNLVKKIEITTKENGNCIAFLYSKQFTVKFSVLLEIDSFLFQSKYSQVESIMFFELYVILNEVILLQMKNRIISLYNMPKSMLK